MRVAFVYLSLVSSAAQRRVTEERFQLRPRLGIGYLRSALKKRGIETIVYDQVLTPFNVEEIIGFLRRDQIGLAGFYVISRNLDAAARYIREIKKMTAIPVIAGGPGCGHYKELIEAGCEAVCIGEGDQTITELLDHYEGGASLAEIRGICYRDPATGEIAATPERPLIDDLDTIPFPHREPGLAKRYCDYFAYPLKKPYIAIMASRGCPCHCSFCTSYSFWRKKYRRRSAGNVIREIKQAVDEFNIRSVEFVDDIFALDFQWLAEFCSAIKDEHLRLTWMCNLHPSSFGKNREEAFSLMKESGCAMISFGAQSADAGILERVNRGPDEPRQLREAIVQAKSAGITVVVTYIFGLPGETEDTLRKDLQFCLETKPHILDFHPLDVIPFSELSAAYPDGKTTALDAGELASTSMKYMLNYYMRPSIAFQLVTDMVRKNPARVLAIGLFGLDMLRSAWHD